MMGLVQKELKSVGENIGEGISEKALAVRA